MAWNLPYYIGHPGYQYSPQGVPSMLYENTLNDTLQIAEITPLKPEMQKNINLYKGVNAWKEYKEYLSANNISPGKADGKLRVVLSQIQPLSESYNNEFGPSELASSVQSVASGSLQELAFMNDFKGKQSLEEMEKKGGLGGAFAGMYKGATDKIGDVLGDLTNTELGNDARELLQNPTAKIDIPSMWKGCSFTSSYQITIRLYCFSPENNDHFTELILAPMGALLMFVTPKSDRGKFYTWPFMMDFKIPGQVHIPLGYCQSMDVVKGGDVSDISWIKRPGTVDLRMTINTVFGVKTNAKSGADKGQRPTIIDELREMNGMTRLNQTYIPEATSFPGNSESKQPWNGGRNDETPQQAEDAVDALGNEY